MSQQQTGVSLAGRGRDWVAIILAIGLATALNCITAAILYDAIFSNQPGISENAIQILIGWGGGIVGVLGSYIGFRASEARAQRPSEGPGEPPAP